MGGELNVQLLTDYENVLHIREIAVSELYESFQLFSYINIISVP